MICGNRISVAVLESTVLDELGVDATIPRVVDVLKEAVREIRGLPCARKTHLVQKAIAIGVTEFPRDVATRGLNQDLHSSDEKMATASNSHNPRERHHVEESYHGQCALAVRPMWSRFRDLYRRPSFHSPALLPFTAPRAPVEATARKASPLARIVYSLPHTLGRHCSAMRCRHRFPSVCPRMPSFLAARELPIWTWSECARTLYEGPSPLICARMSFCPCSPVMFRLIYYMGPRST